MNFFFVRRYPSTTFEISFEKWHILDGHMSSIFILDAFSMKITLVTNFDDLFSFKTSCYLYDRLYVVMSASLAYLEPCVYMVSTLRVPHKGFLVKIGHPKVHPGFYQWNQLTIFSMTSSQKTFILPCFRRVRNRVIFLPSFFCFIKPVWPGLQACCAWHWPWAFTLRYGTFD